MDELQCEILEQAKAYTFENKQILVVDDNEMSRQMAQLVLSKMGAVVDLAKSGAEAVAMIEARGDNLYEFVLMDTCMPEMSGLECVQHIRALPRKNMAKTPVFAIASDESQEEMQGALDVGMNGYFVKPLDYKELAFAIGKYMESGNSLLK